MARVLAESNDRSQGDQYEEQSDYAVRKAAGIYYTPEVIINYILNSTLAGHDVVDKPFVKTLDPACGCGHFLAVAYDLLLAKFIDKLGTLRQRYSHERYAITQAGTVNYISGHDYWQEANLHYHIICHCLYGADIDKQAADITIDRLLKKDPNNKLDASMVNIVVGDSLIKWEEDYGEAVLSNFWQQRYDYVVGNPPYVSFGLKRVAKLDAGQARYLRQHYPRSAEYKISYYALFFERSIAVLKPCGFLGFITPDSYLLGRFYSKLRQYMLETCAVKELALVTGKVFPRAMVGISAISILQKVSVTGEQFAGEVSVKKLDNNGNVTISHCYGQQYFAKQAYQRFRLFFHWREQTIVDKMDVAPYRFGDIAKVRTGMRSLTTQADIKSKDRLGSTWQRGLVSSAQVTPFGLSYQGDWLDVNPEKLNKGGWDKAVMAGPKIFLRQTGDSLIAAIDQEGFYHLNNVHSVTVIGKGISLEYILCILNSRLINFYYQAVTLEKGRSMAQVDIETVEKLPVFVDQERAGLLTRLGRRLAELKTGIDQDALVDEYDTVYKELNQAVYAIYGISAAEIDYVEQAGGRASKKAKAGVE